MRYQRCTRCIMDTVADPNITFDAEGHCQYCNHAIAQINTTTYFPMKKGNGVWIQSCLKSKQMERESPMIA